MNLRDLAQQFGVSVAILKRLLPDLFTDEMTGSTYLPPDTVRTARNAWEGRVRGNTDELLIVFYMRPTATPEDTMRTWHAVRRQLSLDTSGRWVFTIDPFDEEGHIRGMVTLYGETKWIGHGVDLNDILVQALDFLRKNMQ